MEYELLSRDYRLRWLNDPATHAFNWRDLHVILLSLPPDSALAVSLDGQDAVTWSTTNQLLAACADALNYLQWTKTEASQKSGAQPPKPIPRPGVVDENKLETDSMDKDEALDFLGPRFSGL